ncbi:MAG: hypothetical protein ACOC3V_00940 [bacterium]
MEVKLINFNSIFFLDQDNQIIDTEHNYELIDGNIISLIMPILKQIHYIKIDKEAVDEKPIELNNVNICSKKFIKIYASPISFQKDILIGKINIIHKNNITLYIRKEYKKYIDEIKIELFKAIMGRNEFNQKLLEMLKELIKNEEQTVRIKWYRHLYTNYIRSSEYNIELFFTFTNFIKSSQKRLIGNITKIVTVLNKHNFKYNFKSGMFHKSVFLYPKRFFLDDKEYIISKNNEEVLKKYCSVSEIIFNPENYQILTTSKPKIPIHPNINQEHYLNDKLKICTGDIILEGIMDEKKFEYDLLKIIENIETINFDNSYFSLPFFQTALIDIGDIYDSDKINENNEEKFWQDFKNGHFSTLIYSREKKINGFTIYNKDIPESLNKYVLQYKEIDRTTENKKIRRIK